MKKLLFVCLVGLFISCEKPKKTYYYVEKVNEEMLNGTFEIKYKRDTIYADNDSIALRDAFLKFYISKKLDIDYKEKNYIDYHTTIDFSLLNDTEDDITHSNIMLNRSAVEMEIMNLVNNRKNILDSDTNISDNSDINNYDQNESGMAAQVAQEYVKARLLHPSTADFQYASISHKRIDASTYQIMQKFTAKNSYNLEIEYIYKIHLRFKGGNSADSNNWDETFFKMEEYGK